MGMEGHPRRSSPLMFWVQVAESGAGVAGREVPVDLPLVGVGGLLPGGRPTVEGRQVVDAPVEGTSGRIWWKRWAVPGVWAGGQAPHGDEVGCGVQDGLVVPAQTGAALEVVQPEAVLEFAVVAFGALVDLRRPNRRGPDRGVGQGGEPGGRSVRPYPRAIRWSSISLAGTRPGHRGVVRLAPCTRLAANRPAMAAFGLPGPALVPCRQVVSVTADRKPAIYP
jgi:hypothetical protein